tara:strand:- start:282 stop:470 length:189 start_codon:yes stop_codon:yes gene_type:complete
MKYCESTFAKTNDEPTCGKLAEKIAKVTTENKLYIYYLCDLHTELLKYAETNLVIESFDNKN